MVEEGAGARFDADLLAGPNHLETVKRLQVYENCPGPLAPLAFSPDGSLLAINHGGWFAPGH